MRINCPKCNQVYEVDADLCGKDVQCEKCGEVFTVPQVVRLSAAPAEEAARDQSDVKRYFRWIGYISLVCVLADAAAGMLGSEYTVRGVALLSTIVWVVACGIIFFALILPRVAGRWWKNQTK